jgi:hypothetical protein
MGCERSRSKARVRSAAAPHCAHFDRELGRSAPSLAGLDGQSIGRFICICHLGGLAHFTLQDFVRRFCFGALVQVSQKRAANIEEHAFHPAAFERITARVKTIDGLTKGTMKQSPSETPYQAARPDVLFRLRVFLHGLRSARLHRRVREQVDHHAAQPAIAFVLLDSRVPEQMDRRGGQRRGQCAQAQ